MARLRIRVQPGASRSEIVGLEGEVLRLRVTAPPVEGRANEAVIELLARALRVPKSAVIVERGHRGREKVLLVEGLDDAELLARLNKRTKPPSSGSSARAEAPPGE